jgi:hypothetical protein
MLGPRSVLMDDGDVSRHLCRFVLDDKDADRPTASLSSKTRRQGCRDEVTPLLEVFGLQRPGATSNNNL